MNKNFRHIKLKILEAINKDYNENFKTFEEIFDVYTPSDCITAYLRYYGFGDCVSEMYSLFCTFYNMYQKKDDELFD